MGHPNNGSSGLLVGERDQDWGWKKEVRQRDKVWVGSHRTDTIQCWALATPPGKMAGPMKPQISRLFEFLSAEPCLLSLKDLFLSLGLLTTMSLSNSYCSLDNLMPKINLYLLSEHGVESGTVRKWNSIRCRAWLFSLSKFLCFMTRLVRIGEPLNFHSTPPTLIHLPINLLLSEYLRARHKLSTSDAAVRKTQVVPPSRSLQRRWVMSKCHEV